jgi:FkbM family methyltransferase
MKSRKRVARWVLDQFVILGFDVVRSSPHRKGRPRGRRVDEFCTEFVTDRGTFVVPNDAGSDDIVNHIVRGLVFEGEIVDACSRFIPKGGTVVDVGANLGQMSIEFSRLVGPEGTVYSCEAQPSLIPLLRKNVERNGIAGSQVVFGAIGEESGGFAFFPKPNLEEFSSYGSYPLPLEGQGSDADRVPRLSLDADFEFGRLDFLKVDVQGYDLFVLRGAREQIRKFRPTILFEFESQFQDRVGTSFQDYLDFLREIEYIVADVFNGINYLCVPQ